MSNFTLFCWPNYKNRDELAKEHFEKAKEGINNLILDEDVAFCLGYNASYDTGSYVLYLVGAYRGGINDSKVGNALDEFFKSVGVQTIRNSESPDIGRDLTTVDNFANRLAQHGIRVVWGPVIKRIKSQTFPGKSVDAAKATAEAAILSENDIQLEVVRDVQEKTTEGKGKSASEAIDAAKAQVPPDAFDIGDGRIIHEGKENIVEVQADLEVEAGTLWKKSMPEGAQLLTLECTLEPKKGFMGIGRKRGIWKCKWLIPFKAQVDYKMPAVVQARILRGGLWRKIIVGSVPNKTA